MIARRPFGATGHESSCVIFGAAALGHVTQGEADAALPLLLEHGVNHIDTAASYGDSELRLAPWLREHRDAFFLATKTGERTYAAAREEIRRSLERLGVDHVDLIQLHCLVHPAEWDVALGEDGALRPPSRRETKGSRVTSVSPVTASRSPRCTSAASTGSRSTRCFCPTATSPCRTGPTPRTSSGCSLPVGNGTSPIQTIKGISRGPWGSSEHTAGTWYEPLVEQEHVDLAVHWVLGEPGVFLNSAGDLELLPRILDAAERFESRPDEAEMAALTTDLRLTPLFV